MPQCSREEVAARYVALERGGDAAMVDVPPGRHSKKLAEQKAVGHNREVLADIQREHQQGEEMTSAARVQRHAYVNRRQDTTNVLKLLNDPFKAATKKGSKTKQRIWAKFVAWYCGRNPELDGLLQGKDGIMLWPMSQDQFIECMEWCRQGTSSQRQAVNNVGEICRIGISLKFGRAELGPCTKASLDPRKLYEDVYRKTLNIERRHYGRGASRVVETQYFEARNAGNFIDDQCPLGWAQAAAFNFGNRSARRSRTVAQIQLRDIELVADQVYIEGVPVMVPALRMVRFVDEKFDHAVGDRLASERFSGMRDYLEWRRTSTSWFLYQLLAYRGAFTDHHPILTAKKGDVLKVRPACDNWYLFPRFLNPDIVLEGVPCREGVLSNWSKGVYHNMGQPARGYSSHRAGFATDSAINDVYDNKCKGISPMVERGIIRGGGWSEKAGENTIRDHYLSTALDLHLDVGALRFGRTLSVEEVQERRNDWMQGGQDGRLLFPNQSITQHGKLHGPLVFRLRVYRHADVLHWRGAVEAAAAAVLQEVFVDDELYPVNRFCSDGDAFTSYVSAYPCCPHVVHYKATVDKLLHAYNSTANVERDVALHAYVHCGEPHRLHKVSVCERLLMAEEALASVFDTVLAPDEACYMWRTLPADAPERCVLAQHVPPYTFSK